MAPTTEVVHIKQLTKALDDLDRARTGLADILERLEPKLEAIGKRLEEERPFREIWVDEDVATLRDSVISAVSEFEQAFHRLRAAWVRRMRDDEGLSLTEIGRLTGLSRQYVSRLYHSPSSDLGGAA